MRTRTGLKQGRVLQNADGGQVSGNLPSTSAAGGGASTGEAASTAAAAAAAPSGHPPSSKPSQAGSRVSLLPRIPLPSRVLHPMNRGVHRSPFEPRPLVFTPTSLSHMSSSFHLDIAPLPPRSLIRSSLCPWEQEDWGRPANRANPPETPFWYTPGCQSASRPGWPPEGGR
jgi:hypothetical protein